MTQKQNIFVKGLRIVKDTFMAYKQRFASLLSFSLIFYGTVTFMILYVADALVVFMSTVTNEPTFADMEAMPSEQLMALMVILMFVLPLIMGFLLLLSPPGQDVISEGTVGRKGFYSLSDTMSYLRAQYKCIFVSNITFCVLLFCFYILLQYILAVFFMRSDAELLAIVADIIFLAAVVFILPLSGLLVTVCLFEKTMGLAAVRRAISMAKANLRLYGLVCICIGVFTLGSSYLFDWAMTTYVITDWSKTLHFVVSAAWQAIFMPLSYISMLLYYRRTLSLHDVNVLFPS